MEKDSTRSHHNNAAATATTNRSGAAESRQTTSDFVLQWGNRKRLRCMKVQVKDESKNSNSKSNNPVHTTTVRVDRRVVRADKDTSSINKNQQSPATATNNNNNTTNGTGHFNLRQRHSSPSLHGSNRVLKNSENSSAMRGQSNGGVRRLASPDRRGTNNHHHHHDNNNNKSGASSETAQDGKKGGGVGGGGSSSGSGEAAAAPPVWPPKFVIALTNKEKEEDFFAFKGSKLPQRPKKRAKFIQRTLNFVSPGAWLCDLTLERYEVREKKISKKRPRGLKAMGNMDSDSE